MTKNSINPHTPYSCTHMPLVPVSRTQKLQRTNERYKSNMSLDFSKRFDVCTNFINGKFESAGKTMDVFDPSTGDKITKVHLSTKDDVDVRHFRSSISLMNDSSTP